MKDFLKVLGVLLGIGLCLWAIMKGVSIAYDPPLYRCEGIEIKQTTAALLDNAQLFESMRSEERESFKTLKKEIDGFLAALEKSQPLCETAVQYLDVLLERLTTLDNHDFKVDIVSKEMVKLARQIKMPYVCIDLLKYFLVLILVLGGIIGLFLVFRWLGEMALEERRKETADQLEKMRTETAEQLKMMRKETADQLEKMRTETAEQLKMMRKETADQLEKMRTETGTAE